MATVPVIVVIFWSYIWPICIYESIQFSLWYLLPIAS